jgi:hypothetical protein
MRPLLVLSALVVLAGAPRAAEKQPTFTKEGVAFLQKHCVSCHGTKVKRADVVLHTLTSDAALLKNRKLLHSVLEVLQRGEMPPKPRPRPALAEVDSFTASVRAVFAHADRNARPDPGRVTVRRLNRVEYGNTIRDLVGIDFNPADDFPDDDVGHGFDNIGDVLTLSPVLMERYLAAAESIVQRAVLANPPKPPQRRMGARYLEPAIRRGSRWRPLDARGNQLHTPYRITLPGEYFFRVRCYARQSDKEPVRVAVLDGKTELKHFEVTAPEKKPVVLELKVDLQKGDHRFFVKLLNPSGDGDKGRNLVVESFQLTGPTDTRPESHRRLLAVTPGTTRDQQTREVLSRFASRAFRRPATKVEVERLAGLADAAQKRGDAWEAGIQFAMQAVLVSPKFLFRVELGEGEAPAEPGQRGSAGASPSPGSPRPIDDYPLASRLSYFLWSTMPDDELSGRAAKKQLSNNLDAQVRRLLRDPKSSTLTENFALQWLQLRRLKQVSPDPKLFPTFNDRLRSAMLEETKLFFAEIVREDRSILDLIDGRFTYLNYDLARHYGIRDTVGTRDGKQPVKAGGRRIFLSRFVRVELPEGDDRAGILAHASVLTVTSNPTRTSPVKRGRWVLEQILGTPPPPPPPDVPELADNDKAVLSGSLRQRMEQHRTNPACASCHARMDPIGFAFENFDAVGRYRSHDGKFAIDPSGTLPDGRSFKGPAELKTILRDKKELFARNLTEKMLTYALGRGLEHYDKPAVDRIVAALEKNEYRFSTLVTEIAKSFPFRMRRGKDLSR